MWDPGAFSHSNAAGSEGHEDQLRAFWIALQLGGMAWRLAGGALPCCEAEGAHRKGTESRCLSKTLSNFAYISFHPPKYLTLSGMARTHEAAAARQAQDAHLAPGVALQVGGMAQQFVQGAALAAGPLGDAQVAQVRLHDGWAHVQGLRHPLRNNRKL